MAKKPRKSQRKDSREEIVEQALALAAEQGWERVSLADIAKDRGISLAELHGHFEDKSDILTAFGRMIDRRVLEAVGQPDPEASPRDRLFDILMERFDALNEYRNSLVPILHSFKTDPKQAVISLPHLCKSMSWMLEAAGLDTAGIKGALRLAGLTALYTRILVRVWVADESADLGKTMAALDRDLGRAENFAQMLGL